VAAVWRARKTKNDARMWRAEKKFRINEVRYELPKKTHLQLPVPCVVCFALCEEKKTMLLGTIAGARVL